MMDTVNGIEYIVMTAGFLETDDWCRPPLHSTDEQYEFYRMSEVIKDEKNQKVMVEVVCDEETGSTFSLELKMSDEMDIALSFPEESDEPIHEVESSMTDEEYDDMTHQEMFPERYEFDV